MKLTVKYGILAALILCSVTAVAQEEEKDLRPVRAPFETGMIVDLQTVKMPTANTLEFLIMHRFGPLNSETFDLMGLYAPANIRMAFNYTVLSNVQIGLGTTKNGKLQDLNWKWKILEQNRANTIPLFLVYYGNIEYDAREKESFGEEYKATHRFNYFHEIMVGRRFGPKLSLQLNANYSHHNQIDTSAFPGAVHDNLNIAACGRYKFTPSMAAVFEYIYPLTTPDMIKPTVAVGLEIGTSAHAFQIFLSNGDAISPQGTFAYNTKDITNREFLLGFNITRVWNF